MTAGRKQGYSQLPQDQAGVSTTVTNKSKKNLPPAGTSQDTWDDRQKGESTPERKEQALPIPPDHSKGREVEQKTPVFNTPGESGSQPDGKSLHKDKARTKSKPGEFGDEREWLDNSHGYRGRRPGIVASKGYYDATPGVALQEIIDRWQLDGQKMYDQSTPLMFPVAALWPYREYTWTRENSRSGWVYVEGRRVDLSGPRKWDALVDDLKNRGWQAREPLHFTIGREGGAKVGEGNHRLAVCRELGIRQVPVEFHFVAGRVTRNPQNERDEIIRVKQRAIKEAMAQVVLTAAVPPEQPYPGPNRQHDQKGQARGYYKRYYQKNKGLIKNKAKKWYNKRKRNPALTREKERRRDHPEKFERKPGGGYKSPADRSQDWREEQKEATAFVTSVRRVASFYMERFTDPSDNANRPKMEIIDRQPGRKVSPGLGIDIDEKTPDNSSGSARVIPPNRDFVNNTASIRLAYRISEIEKRCAPDLRSKASLLKVQLKRVDATNAMWHFAVQGSKVPYTVRVQTVRKGNVVDPHKTDVLVSCECPFWRWQGPEHWAKQNGYLYGHPAGTATAPKVKDPGEVHWACKHVLAALRHIRENDYKMPAPRGKKATGARYIADRLVLGRVTPVYPEFNRLVRAVADRYLQRSQ